MQIKDGLASYNFNIKMLCFYSSTKPHCLDFSSHLNLKIDIILFIKEMVLFYPLATDVVRQIHESIIFA
jgi:hypothetical protein